MTQERQKALADFEEPWVVVVVGRAVEMEVASGIEVLNIFTVKIF